MNKTLLVACAAACFATGAVVADDKVDESKPVELTVSQMDQITAGSLDLPSGHSLFVGLQLHGDLHPALQHSRGAPGPWMAHLNDTPIGCTEPC
jgi:hypothetical protein